VLAAEVEEVRGRLDAFVGEVFASLSRRDQRAKSGLYLQGLMLEGRRKSMQPMGERLGVDHQQLQQFVSSSPWAVEPVRRVLADKAIELIEPAAWVIDDTGFVKDGPASPGVARQYSGTVGKVANVQVAVSVHAVSDQASCPVDWRLFLPESWDDQKVPAGATEEETQRVRQRVRERRARARIPETQRHKAKWEQALEMLDELATWGHRPPVVAADAGYGESSPFRTGLTERGIPYVVAVKATTSVHRGDATFGTPPYSGRGRPPVPGYLDAPVQVQALVSSLASLDPQALEVVSWRAGTRRRRDNPRGLMSSRFLATRVRPANRTIPKDPDGTLPECWLLAEWPAGTEKPTDYWLSTLPETTTIATLVRMAKIRWRIEHDYRELKHGLGLDHFEGRTWLGWHHHATLVSAAHLFTTTLRLTSDPKANGAA
jgi:SRSO17 transposase